MQEFFQEHWGVAATIMNILAGGCVLFGAAWIKLKFGHIDDEQGHQNRRLSELEGDVSNLKGDKREMTVEMRSLGKLLERHFIETEKNWQEQKKENRENRIEHDEIKSLIRGTVPEVSG